MQEVMNISLEMSLLPVPCHKSLSLLNCHIPWMGFIISVLWCILPSIIYSDKWRSHTSSSEGTFCSPLAPPEKCSVRSWQTPHVHLWIFSVHTPWYSLKDLWLLHRLFYFGPLQTELFFRKKGTFSQPCKTQGNKLRCNLNKLEFYQ